MYNFKRVYNKWCVYIWARYTIRAAQYVSHRRAQTPVSGVALIFSDHPPPYKTQS